MGNPFRTTGRDRVTADRVRYLFDYVPSTGIFVWKHPLSNHCKVGERAGCISKGRDTIAVEGTRFPASHIAWLYTHGVWPTYEIDHKDRDPANNRIENLRDIPTTKNCMNQLKRKTNKSGFKGVSEHPQRPDHWWAQIAADGHRYDLGVYPEPWMAAAAYRIAAAGMHGEYAGRE